MLRYEKKCASNTTGVNFHRSMNYKTALNGLAKIHQIFPELQEMFEILVFIGNLKEKVMNHLKQRCWEIKQLKYYLNISVEMTRQNNEGQEESTKPHFRTKTNVLLSGTDLKENLINENFQKIFRSLDEFQRKGSS